MWIVLVLLLFPALAQGAQYFAASNGSGTTCTSAAPCNNLETLIERNLNPGDALHLRCGDVFREDSDGITTTELGTSANRLTLQSYAPSGGVCYQRKGTHTGPANSASLSDNSGVNFTTLGVLRGHRLFNRTKGAHCYVESVSATTLTCAMPLSHILGAPHTSGIDFDIGDRYEVDNRPIVSRASVFTSGWTDAGSSVWSHTVSNNPVRHVWINGKSTHDMMWHGTGTCNASNMASASDLQYCATGSTLFIKSTGGNPGTRFTNPGVEAIHLHAGWSQALLSLDTPGTIDGYWTIKDIAFEKHVGIFLSTEIGNYTVHNVRMGLPQRKNCLADQNCWGPTDFPWQHGFGDGNGRGGELVHIGSGSTAGTRNSILYSEFHGHDCENNCWSVTGASAFNVTLQDCEFYNNEHSAINSAFGTGARNITIERCTFHGSTTLWHTGENSVASTHTAQFRQNFVYDTIGQNDLRLFAGAGDDDQFAILLEDRGTYTHTNNIIAGGNGTGTLARCKPDSACDGSNLATHRIVNSIYYGNDNVGFKAQEVDTRVRINNSIFAQNGSGAVSSSSFQVGCNQNCGTADDIFQDTVSENNKFRHASGSNFAFIDGVLDEVLDLAQWQSVTDGDQDSVVTADCFVSPGTYDFNFTVGCNDIIAQRGPFRELTFASAVVGTTATHIDMTFTIGAAAPKNVLSVCDKSKLTVMLDADGPGAGTPAQATIVSCTPASLRRIKHASFCPRP